MIKNLEELSKAANQRLDLGLDFVYDDVRIEKIHQPGLPAFRVSCEGRLFSSGDRGRAISDFAILLQRRDWPSKWEPWDSYKQRLHPIMAEDEKASLDARITLFVCPEGEGEVESLLHEIRQATVLDMRVADELPLPPHGEETPRREGESPIEHMSRAWRFILPGDDAGDARTLRIRHGWSTGEVNAVAYMLIRAALELRRLSEDTLLSGTRATLILHAERLDTLRQKWESLTEPHED